MKTLFHSLLYDPSFQISKYFLCKIGRKKNLYITIVHKYVLLLHKISQQMSEFFATYMLF